jgi:uncharacterized protein YjbI with pentapeptide repeats
LNGAFLNLASLEGANLDKADLQGASLRGARYDEKTIFPNGFNPETNGLIFNPVSSE